MKLPKFIKLPAYKKFNYTPIYYDPKKEELNKKMKEAFDKKNELESGTYKPDLKGKFKRPHFNNQTIRQRQAANLKFGLVVIFLAILLYYLIKKGHIIEKMMEALFSG
jgi:hypothetical protein